MRTPTSRGVLLTGLLAAIVGLPAAGRSAPLSAVDSRGKRIVLPAPPRRIVSLLPSNTEILFALGLGSRIVADTANCDYPPEAARLPHVGDFTTSVEKVVAQKPDLVVASLSANRAAVQRLDSLGIAPVFVLDATDFTSLYRGIDALGCVTGQTRQAAQLIRRMRDKMTAVERAVARDRVRPRVLFVVQAQPLWVVGAGSFMDDLVRMAGGVNVTHNLGRGYFTCSLERAVALRPDFIFQDRQQPVDLRGRPGWSSMPAVRCGAVYALGPEAERPGPRLVGALEEMARRLHPRVMGR